MIYAEIIYTGKKTKKGDSEFYLQLYGKDSFNERNAWIKHIESMYNSTKGDVFHDIYFTRKNPAYLISREFVLDYLIDKKFIPVSENFFYKK